MSGSLRYEAMMFLIENFSSLIDSYKSEGAEILPFIRIDIQNARRDFTEEEFSNDDYFKALGAVDFLIADESARARMASTPPGMDPGSLASIQGDHN